MKKTKRKVGRPRKRAKASQEHNPSTGQLFAGLMAIMITIGVTYYTQKVVTEEIALSRDYTPQIANFSNLDQGNNFNLASSPADWEEDLVITSEDLERAISREEESARDEDYFLNPPQPEEIEGRLGEDLLKIIEAENRMLETEGEITPQSQRVGDEKSLRGDVNGDLEINNQDIDAALEILNKFSPYDTRADLFPKHNPDGQIDADDIDELIKIVQGKSL